MNNPFCQFHYLFEDKLSYITRAIEIVHKLTLSSHFLIPNISRDVRDFLKQTVKDNEYILYRGIGLVSNYIKPEFYNQIDGLKVGDTLPEFLSKRHKSNYTSYSKKKSVANRRDYTEGRVSILVESVCSSENILVDLEYFPSIVKDSLDSDFVKYCLREKEVIVVGGVPSKIISINGKFNKVKG